MRVRAWFYAIAALPVAALVLGWAQPPSGQSAPAIDAPDEATRRAAVAELLQRAQTPRDEVIAQLTAAIKAHPQGQERTTGAPKALAIDALGQLRATEAIGLLVDEIDYTAAEWTTEATPWGGRPCIRALVAMGLPAGVHVLRPSVLEKATPERLRDFALVVRYVFPDAQTARAFVAAYDPGYDAAAKAKHAQLQELLAKLP